MRRKQEEPSKLFNTNAIATIICVILLLAGAVFVFFFNNHSDKKAKAINTSSDTTSNIKLNGVHYEKVVAYPKRWTRKVIPHGYHWTAYRDPVHGVENKKRRLMISVNDKSVIDFDKNLGYRKSYEKGSSIKKATLITPAVYVEFMSLEQEPIYILYGIVKK